MRWLAAVVALVVLGGCGGGAKRALPTIGTIPATIALSSPAFADGGAIPAKYTCKGEDVSPPLRWSGVPQGTRELRLGVSDADARGFVHWDVSGIPADRTSIDEGTLPPGAKPQRNGFGKVGWGGPCPPSGTHHYVLTLTAIGVGARQLAVGRLTATFKG